MGRVKQSTTSEAKRADMYKAGGKTVRSAVAVELASEPKKKRRMRRGTLAIRNVRKEQKSTDLLLRKAAVQRLARECSAEYGTSGKPIRFSLTAIGSFHEGLESAIIELLAAALQMTLHARRKIIKPADIYEAAVQLGYKTRPTSAAKSFV